MAELDRLSDLVAAIGSPQFHQAYSNVMCGLLRADHCTVFAASPASRRTPDVNRGNQQKIFADDVGDFGAADAKRIIVRRLTEHGASDKLLVSGERCKIRYRAYFYKRSGSFSQLELDKARRIGGLIIRALHRHRELIEPAKSFEARPEAINAARPSFTHLRAALLNTGRGLSAREADVCANIMLGCSAISIAMRYQVSPNTIQTHRKRAYAKLGIGSRGELYARYFEASAMAGRAGLQRRASPSRRDRLS